MSLHPTTIEMKPDETLAWLFYAELGFMLLLVVTGWIRSRLQNRHRALTRQPARGSRIINRKPKGNRRRA